MENEIIQVSGGEMLEASTARRLTDRLQQRTSSRETSCNASRIW